MGGLEGQVNIDDFQGWKVKLMQLRPHAASITTLLLEAHHQKYPNVSFIHNFPGVVKGGVARGTGFLETLSKAFQIFGRLLYMNTEEAGDRHLLLATSARYPAGETDNASGIALDKDTTLALGTDGKLGSGVYSVDTYGDGVDVNKVLAGLRKAGMVEQVMSKIESGIKEALDADLKA